MPSSDPAIGGTRRIDSDNRLIPLTQINDAAPAGLYTCFFTEGRARPTT